MHCLPPDLLLANLNLLSDSLTGLDRILTTPIPPSYKILLWAVIIIFVTLLVRAPGTYFLPLRFAHRSQLFVSRSNFGPLFSTGQYSPRPLLYVASRRRGTDR